MSNKNSDDYDEKYMKITFNSDNKLPLHKNKNLVFSWLICFINDVYES